MYAAYTCQAMKRTEATYRRGLTRDAIVGRALEIGESEGLDAVSLRRLASEFGVTTMALYRHVRDKQDLVNAMTEAVLDDFDIASGLQPEMSWADRIRRAMLDYKSQMDAHPLALPLAIAYTGANPVAFWRMLEALLTILLDAGFERRQAIVWIRVVSNLLAGYLLLLRQDEFAGVATLDGRELELIRRRVELAQLSLPVDQFPNLVEGAQDLADVWLSDPDRWWQDTVDLITSGLEQMLAARRRDQGGQRESTGAAVT
jgi:TetR/AcrR family tetracycline transcriptional repressor